MVALRRIQLVAIAVLGLGVAAACTSKKKEGGSSGKEEEEEPSDNTNTQGGTTGGTTGESPCLRLDDTTTDTESSTEDEFGSDTSSSSSSDTSSSSSSDTESSNSVSGCGDQSTDTSGGTGGGGGGSYDVGPGIDGCKEQGAVWVAVKATADGKKGACGDPLADFCCTEENIYALFPGMAGQLKSKFGGYTGAGFKLYGCSAASGKYSFHFAKGDSGADYKSAYITGTTPQAGVTPPASCPAVTLEDMGFSAAGTDTETDSGSDSNTDTSTNTDTTTIPTSIGEIANTSKAGLFTFLSEQKYKDTAKFVAGSRHDAANSTVSAAEAKTGHGDVAIKAFYSKTLQTTDKAWSASSDQQALHSIAVLEVYDGKGAGADLKGWALMAKAFDKTGKSSWLFVDIVGTEGNGPVFSEIDQKTRELGNTTCAGCHDNTGNHDLIRSRAP